MEIAQNKTKWNRALRECGYDKKGALERYIQLGGKLIISDEPAVVVEEVKPKRKSKKK